MKIELFDKKFNPSLVTADIVEWIQNFFEKNGKDCNAVIAISGGKDSSVAAGLCVKALGRERVIGVLLPNGFQSDIDASLKLVKHLGIKHVTVNIKSAYQELLEEVGLQLENRLKVPVSRQTEINLPARLRMTATYGVAQSVNGRVVNTCNLSEDWVGYSTRYGDSVGDFSPLSMLTVEEVRAIGTELGLPEELVYKVPIDGLTDKTDEDNLGFSYAVLDKYIRTGICEDKAIKEKIDKKHKMNKFKLKLMPIYPHNGSILAKEEE